jgi:Uma2 family endonuclease
MTIPAIKAWTVEEFEAFAESGDNRHRLLELINGEVVEKMPTEEHGITALNFGRYIGNFIEEHEIQGYAGVEVRHRRPGDKYNSRLPDVSYRSTTTPVVTKGAVPQMPDLAIEIQSPDDTLRDMRATAEYYLRNGSKLVLLAYPSVKMIEACILNAEGMLEIQAHGETDSVDCSVVIPGLVLFVEKIFPK